MPGTFALASLSSASKKRLDELLPEKDLTESRSMARALILAGRVFVDGVKQDKAGFLADPCASIAILPAPRFVSRGGEKLEAALEAFGLSVKDRICLDVGSSTGGFTDCLLQRGAAKVYAVDVGRGQLHPRIRSDPRVQTMEKTHILRLDPASLKQTPSFACVDVSFISLRKVLPAVAKFLGRSGVVLTLFKPQFEVGPENLKKGIVKNEEASQAAREEFEAWARGQSLRISGWNPSALKGAKGNQEYFALMKTSS
jgi:23S rRNA (cytidine1920-2'-O)/16S rRNA (cytidine1409-2'-O)-methyltransferase